MIRVILDDRYVVTNDELNYILNLRKFYTPESKYYVEGSDNEYLEAVSYHGNITGALESWRRRQRLNINATTFDEILTQFRQIDDKYYALVKQHFNE